MHLIDRAKALLARSAPGKSLGEIHLEAMRLLVTSLEKQKLAVTERPRATVDERAQEAATNLDSAKNEPASRPRQESATQSHRRRSGRHIPAAIRRAVYERDGARCTFVDERGQRCQEINYLELHHRRPFGKQGAHTLVNLTLHCRAHNALAAELDFGREHMAQRQQPARHESLASERRAAEQAMDAPD